MQIEYDINGNKCLKYSKHDLGGARGFSIQTNVNLPETHRNGIGPYTDKEVRDYLKEYGSKREKELFGL